MSGIIDHHIGNPKDESKFNFADISFLPLYFKNNPHRVAQFKQLLDSNKLDLLNCGYSMPDQALPHFDDLIGVFEYGREYCLKVLDRLPRVGWAIDTFGQSLYHSRLYAEMGYHSVVTNRIPYKTKSE